MSALKVVISDSGILTPFGNLESTVKNLLACKSSIKKENLFGLSIPFASFEDPKYRNISEAFSIIKKTMDLTEYNNSDTVFIYAAAKGDLSGLEGYYNYPNESIDDLPSPILDKQAEQVATLLQLQNTHRITISNACASGQIAIETAKELLETDQFKTAIVTGFDALSKFTVSGFNSLSALSHSLGARPFDESRDGLTMGECAGIAILKIDDAKENDIVIMGAGSSNDANHRTGPSRTGDGLLAAIKSSLRDANITENDIAAVKCHGTSTNYNDAMEAKALYSLFQDNCPPAASLKGALGHMSGGGSLVETLIAAEILHKRLLPPTMGLTKCGVEEPIKVSPETQAIEGNKILCLSAGFGGLNSSIILEKVS